MVTDSTSQSDATTAFLRAARSGNLEKVIEYLNTDLDINTANSNGLNALHLASKDGHVEIVTELLKRGAKVDSATKKGNTALHIASLAGQSEIVNILIQYGAAVNIQSQNGFTPLYMAAQENHDQVVKLLLSNGANQSLATEDGFTPLAVAMQQGHDKVVSVLLENDSKGKVRLPALHIAAKKDDCKAADLLLQNDHKPDVTSKSGFTPLHIAAHYGNEDIARLLIKRGADVNYLAKHNISPLHVAAKWGKNNMVKILLENGAVIDAKTRDGLTPLHCAARSGHEQCVTTLLENSAPISARTKNGLAPLHMASQGDHVDAARVLLYHRAPVDEVTIDYLTSLHVAAHCGHVRVAKLLLDRKADPNARALNGFTPLHIACKKNRIKVVELLLKHGASIESTTESGLTPLHVASFMGCMNIVIFLLQHEANPDVPTVRGETPLHLAARANQTDIIRILLRNGAKVDARAREQQTPLHIASRLGNVDIVMLLLQHGAAVDTTTKDMYTALHIAAKEGQEEVAAILVDNNASVKATTKNGFTPLHVAAKYGNMNVAKILLQKDSKLDAQGKNDITPLLLACHYDHPNVAQLLLEKGASPYLASQNGQTPLHIAARKNQMDIATTLLEHGAKANVESKAGFTPLHLSAQKGHYDMTNLLIEHGADPNHKAKNGLTALHLCAQEDFIRVASILVKNGANVESETETGYRPIHVAGHFGNLSMIRFLLKHNAEIDVKTKQNYTPLHQAAQQGHAHIVSALIEGNASHRARTNDGLTALNIAQKLGYISVMEVLKGLSYDGVTPDNKNWEEKYKVIAPESLQETSLMSDSDDEGGSDALISEQPYRYLTADLMKSLRDDSLPIDVTRDDPLHKQLSKEEHQEFVQSNNYCSAENFDSTDFSKFLVSFLVDARGGTMKGTRHSGIRLIVPPRRATMPIRVTCRLVKPSKMAHPPPLMEGESLATRVIEMGPVGATFLGPVLIDIPHFASVTGKDREIIILRSENGETWKEHDNSVDNDDTLLNTPYDPQMNSLHSGRITRIITTEFPQYFAIVTRIKQEVHVIGAEGGILISSVASNVQAVFPPGALTKKIKVGLQAHVIPAELTAKLLGNCVAVSPVITIEPRRRKFHKPISLTLPVPQAANKGMINHYGGETPTLRLLCSIAGGTSEAQWEDVTGSTPLNFMNDRVSFTTTVSARFWLMDCRNVQEVPKMATDLYRESLHVPFITNFVIYSKRMEEVEATLRILCMTDSKEGVPTLEKQEEFAEIVKSRDVETLDGKDLYIEFSGNLVPVTKSGVQLKFTFKAFRQNRLSFHVKVKDPQLDPVARMMFMREPKVAKGEPAQQPICVLNIVLPEITYEDKNKGIEDSNIISQKMDVLKSKYTIDYHEEKSDQPKRTSPVQKKFITDTLQKEQTDAAHKIEGPESGADSGFAAQDAPLSPPSLEKKSYAEKRRFWEDVARSKRESFQRSESEVSHASQLTYHDSDSDCLSDVRERSEDEGVVGVGAPAAEEDAGVDMSECSVAEKAHYFEEQIQRETSLAARTSSLKSQSSQESGRVAAARLSGISMSSEDDSNSLEVFEETERIIQQGKVPIYSIKEEKTLAGLMDAKEKQRDGFGKRQDSKEKKDGEKKSPVKSKVETDLVTKEVTAKKMDAKGKGSPEKESKPKATKMQENVTKQQRGAESRSPIAAAKSAKAKEEAPVKPTSLPKQKSKDESSPKAVPRQRSKDESFGKSPPKKDDAFAKSPPKRDESLSKSPPKKDELRSKSPPKKDETLSKSPPKKDEVRSKSPPKKDEPLSKSSPKKDEVRSKSPPKKDEPLSKSSPKKDEVSSKSPPKKDEPLSKSPPKKDEPLSKSPPKKDDLLSKSPPKKDDLLSKSPPKKDDLLSKSPPKKDFLSRSPPKKDKSKDDAKFSPKADKSKEVPIVKAGTKVEKEKEAALKKDQTSPILKKDKPKEVSPPKSPPKSDKRKEVLSPTKSDKAKGETTKTLPKQKSKESPTKEVKPEKTTASAPKDSKPMYLPLFQTKDKDKAKDIAVTSTVSTKIVTETTTTVTKSDGEKLSTQEKVIETTVTSTTTEDKTKNAKVESTTTVTTSKDKLPETTLPSKEAATNLIEDKTKTVTEIKTKTDALPAAVKQDQKTAEIITTTSILSKKETDQDSILPQKNVKVNDIIKTTVDGKTISEQTITVTQTISEITKPTSLQKDLISSVDKKDDKTVTAPIAAQKTGDISKTSILTDDKKAVPDAKLQDKVTDKLKDAPTLDKPQSLQKENGQSATPSTMSTPEKLKEEVSAKLPSKDEKSKELPSADAKIGKAVDEIPKSMIPVREKSKEEFSIKSPPKDDKPKELPTAAPKREKSIGEIPKSMIPVREKSKEEFSIKSPPKDKSKEVSSVAPKREKSIDEIPKSMIPKREKSKEEFSIKSLPKDEKPKELKSMESKPEKSIDEISKSIIPKREKSKEEFSIKSPPKDEKLKELPTAAPKREKSIGEIPKSMIPVREKSKEEFSIKSPPKDDKTKELPSTASKEEKPVDDISKSTIPKGEKSKEEFSITSPPKDGMPKDLPPAAKREKSIDEIPKSMIPQREKSKEEFSIKSPPKDEKPKDLPSAAPKREKSIDEIPKSMIPKREKSKEEFSIKSPPKDAKAKDLPSAAPKREKSIDEIPKSMIPKREKSKEEFSIKSPPVGDKSKQLPSTATKREKSIEEIPKSIIPRREHSKEELSIKSPPKAESPLGPKREKSSGEIPKSMIPRREKSKEEFSIKSPPQVDSPLGPKREKSIDEIPKSMIPVRQKSKEEFSIKSPPKELPVTAPKREKSIDEIPKSMIPRREKSKEEFSVKSPPMVQSPPGPKRERSSSEIPKSMIPRREKSKEEFSIKSPPKTESPTGPRRERSSSEIPKSMIPKREPSKEEFSIKSPPKTESPTGLKRERSSSEIPKSMIPRREPSREEFSIKSPTKTESPTGPRRERSSSEIPKSMIPRREKSKEEFSFKREKSIGEIPKSMIPRRETSREEFSIKSPPMTPPGPKRERSSSEIPKSMIPVREKSREEFSIKSPPGGPKRERSSGEIPKSMIPRQEKSKEEFSLKGPPKRELSKEGVPSTSLPKREKSKDEIPKSVIPKREKSKDEIPKSVIPKREKSKDEIPKSVIPKREKSKDEITKSVIPNREKSKEEFSSKLQTKQKSKEDISSKAAPKREKSKEEVSPRPGFKRQDSRGEQSAKPSVKKAEPSTARGTPKRDDSKEDIPSKLGTKRRDSKEDSPKLTAKKTPEPTTKSFPKREKSKEEIPKTPLARRRDSKEDSPKPFAKSRTTSSSSTSSSLKSETPSPKLAEKLPKTGKSKKETETVTVTKREKSEEVTTQEYEERTRRQTSESQVYTGTFTGDPKDALKLLEDTTALKAATDLVSSGSVVTSKVDHKAVTSLEKKEVKSSEIDMGDEKIFAHEEREDVSKKESSSSLLMKQSPEEKLEERESKLKETTVSATQKTLVNLTDELETVQASASQLGKQSEHSVKARSVEDDQKIVRTEETATSVKDSAVGAHVKLLKDLTDESARKEELGKVVEKSMFQEQTSDSSKSFDVKEELKSKAATPAQVGQKVQSPESGTIESEVYHDELADDLTRKFENIMRKSTDEARLGAVMQEELGDISSAHDSLSVSISEDITKDESSSIHMSSSQAKQSERDVTLSPSSTSDQVDIMEMDEQDVNRQKASSSSVVKSTAGSDVKPTATGKMVSELSGARVLEILEPDESQSRQDSMDVSSIEIDEVKFSSGVYDLSKKDEILHESPAVDSLETLEHDVTVSQATFSEDTNIDYSLPRDSQKHSGPQKITISRKTEKDSFELESPPLVSPRTKVKDLEIKQVDWMIGDEKIEVSEPLQPFQAFDKELEEFQKQQEQQQQKPTDAPKKFEIPRIEETMSGSFDEPELVNLGLKSKFTVVPVSEQDLEIERELVENKLDISCQELMDTLQREYDAKTPTEDRLEEMAARSFHFMTVDDDEDSFDYDRDKYEAEAQERKDLPLETKTAVNVIEGERFTTLDEPLKSLSDSGKPQEMMQLYEEQFEATVPLGQVDVIKKAAVEDKKTTSASSEKKADVVTQVAGAVPSDPKKDVDTLDKSSKPSESIDSKVTHQETKLEDSKSIEKKIEKSEAGDTTKPVDKKMEETKPLDKKSEEAKTVEEKDDVKKTEEAKTVVDKKVDEKKSEEKKSEEIEPLEKKLEQTKPADKKPEDSKPIEKKIEDSKSTEKKPDDSKPVEKKPEDSKSVEKKPDDSKPVGKPEDSVPTGKLEDTKSTEVKPKESVPAQKPDEIKPAEKKSEDGKPAEKQPEETKKGIDSKETSDDDKAKQSYDLKDFENPPEPSEMLLKTVQKIESEEKKDDVKLLSYKSFDPEDAKKAEEPSHPPTTGPTKPPRSEIHRDSKPEHRRGSDKREKSHQETSPYKMKKEDFQGVDMSSRYAITVLDQVVKKEIAEVKENLEAAKQDLIEELSENSENVIQIKDSPSEFQFKIQPESIPNELPFLYRAPSLEKLSDAENLSSSSSPVAKPRRHSELRDESSSESSSGAGDKRDTQSKTSASILIDSESISKDAFESFSSSPKAASRSGSDAEGSAARDETFSLQPPQPAPRRRQKPARRGVTSESEADVSSGGEYESAASRPSSSDIEALHSAAAALPGSTTASEYETAAMSFEHSSSKATSKDYQTALETLSSRESMKSLNSLSSGQMGSLDSTSELSETLMASEPEMERDEIDENLEMALDDDMKTSNCTSEDESGKPFDLDPDVPCMMKRSSEMIFSQVISIEQSSGDGMSKDAKPSSSSTLTSEYQSVVAPVPTAKPTEVAQSIGRSAPVSIPAGTYVVSKLPSEALDEPSSTSSSDLADPRAESCSFEPDSLETKIPAASSLDEENGEAHVGGSGLTLQQQLSMTSSSMSGVSLETVIEKEADRGSPDSDSFELVDKPDIIDDFVVVEEVGREAEEFDSEGKGIRISSMSYVSSKNYDRDVENLITEKQAADKQQAHSTRSTTELFEFDSEESPPQASNDEQYSQSYSDEEQYNEGGKKWVEMQFQQNEARLYDLEYDRGPLEDIKEEEVADFEAGSSRFGSLGSHKESIGSIGSMRGSFGSTPDTYDVLAAKRYFKPTDHDNVSLSSLQEFEHLESAVALENARRREQQHSGSQDSSSNGSLPRRYAVGRSGHGDDVSLSSVKDFEVLEKACREAHLIELRAREEEDLLDHESPENRYKLESLARAKLAERNLEGSESAAGSFNPSTSGSDDYEKRIKEIDEIIRIAQANVERIERHDDTTEDISQIELTDTGDTKPATAPITVVAGNNIAAATAAATAAADASVVHEPPRSTTEPNLMETSTDSLELGENGAQNYNLMCRSSDSLELKTTLDYPSLSSDSLNNVRDPKEEQEKKFTSSRRISSDSLDLPVLESQDEKKDDKEKDSISED